jgi:hypothetical protein
VSIVVDLLRAEQGRTPPWLVRPGRIEFGEHWLLAEGIYAELQSRELPELAPPREWRHVDAVLSTPDGETFVLEVDEMQHFNHYRRLTLERYPEDVPLRFDRIAWMHRCVQKRAPEGGGFAKPRPPLFPGENGRHRQRAFRDALADLLPPLHGFGPTLRVAEFEVASWVYGADARDRMAAFLRARGLYT